MTSDPKEPLTYAGAGVDLAARKGIVDRYKEVAKRAGGPQVLGGIGPFAGMFAFAAGQYRAPVLVATTDTVGTKGKLAAIAGRFEDLGRDIVNHCVNDALTTGARPLFFLDTIVNAGLSDDAKVAMVRGVTEACIDAGCVLLGGETADMPGVYVPGGFDLVGFVLGVVERERVIDGTRVEAGDVLLALPSNGLHTNGYSLARPALGIGVEGSSDADDRLRLERYEEDLGEALADALLRPHHSYLREIEPVLAAERPLIKGMAHITGGALEENVPRILPAGLGARIRKAATPPPPIFALIQRRGRIEEDEMYRVFNMGFGMVLAVSPGDVEAVRALLPSAVVCGEVVRGGGVAVE